MVAETQQVVTADMDGVLKLWDLYVLMRCPLHCQS